METVQVGLRREVFERLKALAEPLVDDASSVVERLINHWESTPTGQRPTIALKKPEAAYWRSARGEMFPVGAKLRAKYLGQTFEATVTSGGIDFKGRCFDNPSSAGIAAKESLGTTGKAASTNGWDFWEMHDPESGQWFSIDVLRSTSS